MRHPGCQPRQRPAGQGFTLVELMVVVVVVGVLSAIAFPRYLKAREAAQIGARVGEAIAVARECQNYTYSNLGDPPTRPPLDPVLGGVTVDSCLPSGGGGTIIATWGGARAGEVPCLTDRSTDTSSQARIEILTNSTLSCTFE